MKGGMEVARNIMGAIIISRSQNNFEHRGK